MGSQENSRRTFVLKLNLHCGNCQGCVDKVKKLVKKIQGVDSIKIEEEGKATISGNVDPHRVIKELEKDKKIRAELWGEEEEEESPVPQVNEPEMQISVRKTCDRRKVAPQFPPGNISIFLLEEKTGMCLYMCVCQNYLGVYHVCIYIYSYIYRY